MNIESWFYWNIFRILSGNSLMKAYRARYDNSRNPNKSCPLGGSRSTSKIFIPIHNYSRIQKSASQCSVAGNGHTRNCIKASMLSLLNTAVSLKYNQPTRSRQWQNSEQNKTFLNQTSGVEGGQLFAITSQ